VRGGGFEQAEVQALWDCGNRADVRLSLLSRA
jgi:hypothetical protein